ncbi:MAG: PEP-CTERM sorting domain-containing protein [Planctomycetota bacterium]
MRKIICGLTITAGGLLAAGAASAATLTGVSISGGALVDASIDTDGIPATTEFTVLAADFIGSTLTDFSDSNAVQLITNDTAAPAMPSALVSDGSVAGGIANFDSLEITLDTPLANDGLSFLVLADVGFANDAFSVTANGVTLNIAGAPASGGLLTGVLDRNLFASTNAGATSGVPALDAEAFGFVTLNSSNRNFVAINIEDFGFAPGTSVDTFTISASGYDLAEAFGVVAPIPEPGSLTLAGLSAMCLLVRARKSHR